MCELRVILIGGSSNIGKSTLAGHMAKQPGWRHLSTDKLARHPGRPWQTAAESVPIDVAEHYLTLSVAELIEDVLRHYRSMWPMIESIITKHATDRSTERLVLEGSALWPESVATLRLDNVAAIWLTAGNELFQERIYNASKFGEAADREQMMVQKFLQRTHQYNKQMMEAIHRLGLVSVNVEAASSLDELSDVCLKLLTKQL